MLSYAVSIADTPTPRPDICRCRIFNLDLFQINLVFVNTIRWKSPEYSSNQLWTALASWSGVYTGKNLCWDTWRPWKGVNGHKSVNNVMRRITDPTSVTWTHPTPLWDQHQLAQCSVEKWVPCSHGACVISWTQLQLLQMLQMLYGLICEV